MEAAGRPWVPGGGDSGRRWLPSSALPSPPRDFQPATPRGLYVYPPETVGRDSDLGSALWSQAPPSPSSGPSWLWGRCCPHRCRN